MLHKAFFLEIFLSPIFRDLGVLLHALQHPQPLRPLQALQKGLHFLLTLEALSELLLFPNMETQ